VLNARRRARLADCLNIMGVVSGMARPRYSQYVGRGAQIYARRGHKKSSVCSADCHRLCAGNLPYTHMDRSLLDIILIGKDTVRYKTASTVLIT